MPAHEIDRAVEAPGRHDVVETEAQRLLESCPTVALREVVEEADQDGRDRVVHNPNVAVHESTVPTVTPGLTPEEMRALVRRHIHDGFNQGDWTVCETTLADDYTAYYGADGQANVGRELYVRVCKFLRRSFPDVAITIEDLVVEDATIVMRYIERGTLSGDAFLGIEPAGQRYAKPGTTVYRVENYRLARSWGVEDTLGWFRQLGKYE
jgi:predicted ester cyclase